MPLSIALLVVGSALAHATWNALLKRSKDPENAVVAMMTVAALVALLVAAAMRTPLPDGPALGWIVASGLLEAGYFVTLARALARAPLGSVYTVVRGGALVVVWPVSIALLGEEVTLARAGGTLLVALGLAATSVAERRKAAALGVAPKTPDGARSGLAVAALCALFVGGYHLAYKLALARGGRPEAVNSLSLTVGVLVNLLALGAARRPLVVQALRVQPTRVVAGGVLGAVGFLVFLFAMKDAGAGLVLTLRNVSILFAQAIAFGMGERPGPLGVAGAVLVTGGAVLLSWP